MFAHVSLNIVSVIMALIRRFFVKYLSYLVVFTVTFTAYIFYHQHSMIFITEHGEWKYLKLISKYMCFLIDKLLLYFGKFCCSLSLILYQSVSD